MRDVLRRQPLPPTSSPATRASGGESRARAPPALPLRDARARRVQPAPAAFPLPTRQPPALPSALQRALPPPTARFRSFGLLRGAPLTYPIFLYRLSSLLLPPSCLSRSSHPGCTHSLPTLGALCCIFGSWACGYLSRARLPAQSLGAEAGSSFTFPSAPGRVSATPRSCVRPHPASRAFGVGAAPRGAAGHPRLQAPKRLLGVAPGKLTFRGHCPAWAPQWARGLWEDDCARGGRALRSWPQHLQGEGQRGNEGALLTNQSGTPGPSCCCFPTASKVGVVLQKALLKAF